MRKISIILAASAVMAVGCKDNEKKAEVESVSEEKMENNEESNWVTLFNGENLEGWKAFNRDSISQWKVEDGALAFAPAEGENRVSENLITKDEFESFELSLEWKISEGGNSGIMWAVQESDEFNEPYLTGPEIQVLDNKLHPDAENGPIRQAGALYDMMPPSADKTRNAEEWNETLIRIDHAANKGTVRLNGTLINEFPLHGEEWDSLVNQSKFKDWKDFGKAKKGHIALQDHDDKVWYRNIKIKELD
ncbi:3-keto-disaccharide hydrolase [Salegentibacter sp. HM20]